MVQNIDVLLYMDGKGWMTRESVMENFDINRTAANNHIKKLSKGKICYQGNIYKMKKRKKGRKKLYKIEKQKTI